MARLHKDVTDLVPLIKQRGGTIELGGSGQYFVVRKDGDEVCRLPTSGKGTYVAKSERRSMERKLVAAGLLVPVHAQRKVALALAHGTSHVLQAGTHQRGRTHQQPDSSGLMPLDEVVGVLHAAVIGAGKGHTNRGGLIKVARDAIETARFRNLTPPTTRGNSADPWDPERIAAILGDFIRNGGKSTTRTTTFMRAHAEQLTDRLDTFIDVTTPDDTEDEPMPTPTNGAAAPTPAPPLLPDVAVPLDQGGHVVYVEQIKLPRTTTLGDAADLVERIQKVAAARMIFDEVEITARARDLWDLRDVLADVADALAPEVVNWTPQKERVR